MTKIKKLAGETVLYGLGNIVPRFLNFLLFPIHTNIFKPEQFGVFTYLMSLVAFLNVIYSFGMETTYFRYATKPGADPRKVFNIALTAVALISFSLSLFFILLSKPLAVALNIPGHSNFIVWLSLIMLIDNIAAIPFARLRLEKKPIVFATFRIINVATIIGLNLFFLFVIYDPAFGIGYVFLANLIANSLYLLFFFRSFLNWRPSLDREMFPSMVRYSFPMMLTGLAAMVNQFFSLVWLERWLPDNFYEGKTSSYAVGVFGASSRFAVLMNLTVTAFRMAAEPFFFSNAAEKDSPQLFARVNHYFIIVCCFILLAISINMDVLKYLMDEAYWPGVVVVTPLMLGFLFLGVYYNLTVWYKLTDNTGYGTLITASGAFLTITLNFILIPLYGYEGSAWATLCVYSVMMVMCYLLGQKYYPIPYHVIADVSCIVLTTALIYMVNSYTPPNPWLGIALHGLILLGWIAAVYLLERKKT